jgi:hypothetical protein
MMFGFPSSWKTKQRALLGVRLKYSAISYGYRKIGRASNLSICFLPEVGLSHISETFQVFVSEMVSVSESLPDLPSPTLLNQGNLSILKKHGFG